MPLTKVYIQAVMKTQKIVSKYLRFFTFFIVLLSASIYANSKSKKDNNCKHCLTTNSDVHQMGSYWDVCQKGTAVCWKFKPEYKDLLLNSMKNTPKGVKLTSKSFQKKMIDIKQDEWGNKTMFDNKGSVIATADYGRSFQVNNVQKGYQERAEQCNDSMYEGGMLDVVNVGPENIMPVPKKYEWIARQIVMVRAGGVKSYGSGVVTGDNCDVVVSTGHTYILEDHKKNKEGKIIKKAGTRVSNYFYAVQDRLRGKKTAQYLNAIETGWDNGTFEGVYKYDPRQDWSLAISDDSLLRNCVNFEIEEDGSCEGNLFLISYQQGDLFYKKYSSDDDCKEYKYSKQDYEDFGPGDGDNVKMFKHGCDTKPISSGGGLFCDKGDEGITWIGINVGYSYLKKNKELLYSKKNAPKFDLNDHYNRGLYLTGRFRQVYDEYMRKSALKKQASQ